MVKGIDLNCSMAKLLYGHIAQKDTVGKNEKQYSHFTVWQFAQGFK